VLVTVLAANTANEAVVPRFTWGWDAEAASGPKMPIRITVVPTRASRPPANWRRRRITGATLVTGEHRELPPDPATFSSSAEVKRVMRLGHWARSHRRRQRAKQELAPCAF